MAGSPEAERFIRRVLEREGPIPFARFMALALYGPGGYYTRPREGEGDYYTAPSVHPAFGALLAVQAHQVWELLGRPRPFWVVEVGGGSGLLAEAFLGWARRATPELAEALRYLLLDPLPGRGDWEAVRTLGLPLRGVVGCVLANEVLDAFPVHRFRVEGGRVREVFVALEEDRLVERLGEPSTPELEEALREAGVPLQEGREGEVCLALRPWLEALARSLERGVALLVDYGGTSEEVYRRPRGTLRCFRRHLLHGNPYRWVGEQDITASVDFSAVARWARRAGLEVLGYASQASFLRALGWDALVRALETLPLDPDAYTANRMALQDLVRPDGPGGFRVLALGKGLGGARLWGFHPERPALRWLEGRAPLPVPLVTDRHLPLARSRYPFAFPPGGTG